MKCFEETGRYAAQPRGGSTSPLEAHADFLLGLIAEPPDLTLDEVVSAMRKRRIRGSRTAVWRFFERHRITFKKSLRAAEQERADVARARRPCSRSAAEKRNELASLHVHRPQAEDCTLAYRCAKPALCMTAK
jgi:hypothetical protein